MNWQLAFMLMLFFAFRLLKENVKKGSKIAYGIYIVTMSIYLLRWLLLHFLLVILFNVFKFLRYYCEDNTTVLFEKWFHCADLGKDLVPIVKSYVSFIFHDL